MKSNILLSFLMISLLLISTNGTAGVMVAEGTYQGKDIIIQNPYIASTKSYCITQIRVNELTQKFDNSSKINVNLSVFKKGIYVNIQIFYKDGCKPFVINPEVLYSKSSFELISSKTDEYKIRWTTSNESSQEPYVVQQMMYTQWVPIGKIVGKGSEGYNNYSIKANHYSGENRYRLKQKDIDGKYVYTELKDYYSPKKPVVFYPKPPEAANKVLYLSRRTFYKIFDTRGYLLQKGKEEQIDISSLKQGKYYLHVDNQEEEFIKK